MSENNHIGEANEMVVPEDEFLRREKGYGE